MILTEARCSRRFTEHGKHLTKKWLRDPRFIIGLLVYEAGFWLTIHSEVRLKEGPLASG